MGRKRKNHKRNNVVGILVFAVVILLFVKVTLLKDYNLMQDLNYRFDAIFNRGTIEVSERSVEEDHVKSTEIGTENTYIEVFFTKLSGSKDVYVAMSRLKPKSITSSDFEYAVRELIKGPNKQEKSQGIYTEIPSSTKILSITEYPNRCNINLSSDFEFGGGGDSLYKRVYQLIKTVTHNTRKPVYLYIDGKLANVIGGEGLMLKQPLRSDSLDE